jgi:hypothetical protein
MTADQTTDMTVAPATVISSAFIDMHENLQQAISNIDEMITEQHAANILTMWRVGEIIYDLEADPDKYLTDKQKSQHVRPLALLSGFFSKTYAPDQFDMARVLYENYPTKEAIGDLVNARCPSRPNWRLTASHVQLLLSIPDKDQREVVAERCVKEAYTTKALSVELTEMRGPAKRAEKKLTAPKGLKQRVYDLLDHQRKFIARSEKLWLSDEGLYDAIMNASPSQLNETIRGYLGEIDENFEKLQEAVQDHRNMIRRVSELLEKIDAESADAEILQDSSLASSGSILTR